MAQCRAPLGCSGFSLCTSPFRGLTASLSLSHTSPTGDSGEGRQ